MKRLIAFLAFWKFIEGLDKDYYKEVSFQKGLQLSQNFKDEPVWDQMVEPFIIRQVSFLTSVSNSFIKGLVSDNVSNEHLRKQ